MVLTRNLSDAEMSTVAGVAGETANVDTEFDLQWLYFKYSQDTFISAAPFARLSQDAQISSQIRIGPHVVLPDNLITGHSD